MDDPGGINADWAAVVIGSSTQNTGVNGSDGVAVQFQNNGNYCVLDGSNVVYGGDGGYAGGVPKGDLRVRLELDTPGFGTNLATVRMFINGTPVQMGNGPGLELVKSNGFSGNYITLGGAAAEGRASTHTFDDLAVWAVRCIEVSTNQVSVLAGQISGLIAVTVPSPLTATAAAQVAVRSLDPSVAGLVGADSNGVLTLEFPAGGNLVQTLSISGLRNGSTAIELSGPTGTCVTAPVAVAVTPPRYTLTLRVNPLDGGTISVDPPPDADGKYTVGTLVTLTAHPTNGGPFLSWGGDRSGTNNPITINVTGNSDVKANFLQPARLQSANIGFGPEVGSTIQANGVDFIVVAGGEDIGSQQDAFRYVYEARSGDFDALVQAVQLAPSDYGAKAGLMVRQNLDTASAHFSLFVTPLTGRRAFSVEQPLRAANSVELAARGGLKYPVWLRLRRQGNVLSALAVIDGTNWTLLATAEMEFTEPVYLGLATTAHAAATSATAAYSSTRS